MVSKPHPKMWQPSSLPGSFGILRATPYFNPNLIRDQKGPRKPNTWFSWTLPTLTLDSVQRRSGGLALVEIEFCVKFNLYVVKDVFKNAGQIKGPLIKIRILTGILHHDQYGM